MGRETELVFPTPVGSIEGALLEYRVRELEAELFEARQAILTEGQILMRLENEVSRLTALVQEHQTYQTKEGLN